MFSILKKLDKKYYKEEIYEENEIVRNELEECKEVFFILEGELSISSYSINGKEIVLNYLTKGVFGNVLCFTSSPYYLGNIICKKKCKLIVIAKNNLLNLLTEDKEFLNEYLSYMCEETIKTKRQAKLFSYKNIEERIMFYLHSLSQDNKSNVIKIKSVTNLAYILCLPRESVSRSLSSLVDQGFITKSNNIITIIR